MFSAFFIDSFSANLIKYKRVISLLCLLRHQKRKLLLNMKSFEALEKYEITLKLFRILKQYYKIDWLLQCFLSRITEKRVQ